MRAHDNSSTPSSPCAPTNPASRGAIQPGLKMESPGHCGSSEEVETDPYRCSSEEPLAGNYFVAAYPPFSAWTDTQRSALGDALQEPAPYDTALGLYVHLPFCQKKCDYCYYLSYIRQKPEIIDRYLADLVREFHLYARKPALHDRDVSFVYFGGGTPSTLSPSQVEYLGKGLRSALRWDRIREITFECAPRSVRPKLLASLQQIGVNRLSMGVQSFDDELLKLNGRVHLANDVTRAYQSIRDAGFEWVNLDLMVGLIGETEEKWCETVKRVIQLGPESVTIYQTEIPYNTTLFKDLESGTLPAKPVSWAIKRKRLDEAFRELERAGYTVVSGYAAVKDPEQHRFHYQDKLWHGCDMLGLGVASFGYFGGVHYQNEVTMHDYETAVEEGRLPIKRAHALNKSDRLVREFILQLKLGRVECAPFHEKFGLHLKDVFEQPLNELQQQGLLNVDDRGVALTRAGLLRVDRMLPEFYDTRYAKTRYT
jgi:oxygen-independent coproporphyrinogen-3 oxidase